jgi:hypothetical protein
MVSLDMLGLTDIKLKKKLTDIGFIFGFSGLRKWFFSVDLDF